MDEKQVAWQSESQPRKVTRRQVLRGMGFTAAAALASQLLAACGATPTPTAAPPAAAAPTQPPAPTQAAAPTAAPTKAPEPTKAAAPAATQAPAAGKTPKAGGKAIWAMNSDPSCLAPFGVLLGPAHDGKEMMYDSLVQWDKNLIVQPALAEKWETPDDKTYIFYLKKGIKFHSGKEMDADDAKYSIEMQSGKNLPPPGAPIGQYPQIVSVDAVDKYTVKLNMKGPDPTVIGWFAWTRWSSIVSKGFYDTGNPCVSENGTGPFKLVEYVANDRVVMTKFPDFWQKGVPFLDDLTLKIIPDEAARIAALRSDAIAGCDISSDTAKTLKNDPNIALLKGITSSPRVLQFSIKGDGKPWNKKQVRQAMSMAMNRQDIIEKVYGGEAVLTGPIPPGYGDWTLPDATLNKYFKFDLDTAKKMMADAGYKDGFPIELICVNVADYPQVAQVVKEQMKALNIDVKITQQESAIFAKTFNDGTFEWFLNGFGMRNDPTGYVNWLGNVHAAQAKLWFNDGQGWENKEMADTFAAVSTNLDQQSRHPQIMRIQELALDEAPFVYLCLPYKFTAVRSYVKDMYVSFTDFRPGLRTTWFDK